MSLSRLFLRSGQVPDRLLELGTQKPPGPPEQGRQVFRDLLFRKLDRRPAAAPWLLGNERFGAPDLPALHI